MATTVALIGTCDTKLNELLYLRNAILQTGSIEVIFIDVGRKLVRNEAITIPQDQLLLRYGNGMKVENLPRSEVIKTMSDCASKAVKELYANTSIHGIISAGGSGGTSLASQVMRSSLPIGFPKMIVSTIASGDTSPIVEETDITMMYSVVDVAGLNQVLKNILINAGAAVAGMARAYSVRIYASVPAPSSKRVGITMFGVTTPAVDTIRQYLESTYDIETYVFHATGHGGKAMERLVREGSLDAVVDLTTTEICDFLTGGNMSAGPDRLRAAAEAGIPNIISLGATDMSNFGPKHTVPDKYRNRLLYEHNPVVTLMRSSAEECRQIGDFIVQKLKTHATSPNMVEVWIPKGGVSILSSTGGPFENVEADGVMFNAIRQGVAGSGIQVVEDSRAINDAQFAQDIANALVRKMGLKPNDSSGRS
ncbi:hypothetical protein CC78DRAFT_29359 [Lojkania enalia]|uniref:Uncharacterized protein n=1 Tax=Lojkania enalia TaxID=147567 RepID=A0A9P4K0F1_9PLEO|nr:hypothetical protein CC78DRAFT_29359 [Didymosphaeria enalia]